MIDVVVKNKSIFDFNVLTELLSLEEETSVIEWYELIMNYDKYTKSTLSINEKMNYIFNSNIKIYPIVDDIQLFHKRDLRIFDNMSRKDTRASISTDYIKNQIIEKQNKPDNIESKNIIYINYLVLFQIIDRLYKQDSAVINSPYYNEIYNYTMYPYINYKEIQKQFVNNLTNLTCIRYSNILQYEKISSKFDQSQYYKLNYKISSKGNIENIKGILFTKNKVSCLKIKHLKNIETYNNLKMKTILIYSTNNCKYCELVLKFLDSLKYKTKEIILDSKKKKEAFFKKYNIEVKTFPKVFMNDKLIGGYEDTVKYFKLSNDKKEDFIQEYINKYSYIDKNKNNAVYYIFDNNEDTYLFNKIYDFKIKNIGNTIETFIYKNPYLNIDIYFKKIYSEIFRVFKNTFNIKLLNLNNIEINTKESNVTIGYLDYLTNLIYNNKIKLNNEQKKINYIKLKTINVDSLQKKYGKKLFLKINVKKKTILETQLKENQTKYVNII